MSNRRTFLGWLGAVTGIAALGGVARILAGGGEPAAAPPTSVDPPPTTSATTTSRAPTSTSPSSTSTSTTSTSPPTTSSSTTTTSSTTTSTSTTTTSTTTTSTTTTTTQPPTTTTLPPAEGDIAAICRDAWGAAAPTGGFTTHQIKRMTVHHTASLLKSNRDAPRHVRGHQRFHQRDRGWSDIAYHFIVDANGHVYECRRVDAVGDTGTNYDPTGHFLVCAEGNFNDQPLPQAQLDSLVRVLAWASHEFGVGAKTIRGHRDWASTSCPGTGLYALIEDGTLQKRVRKAVDKGAPGLSILCGEAADQLVADIEAGRA